MAINPDIEVVVTFKAPKSLVKKLDELAAANDRSRSAEIRQSVLRDLKQQEKTA
jgi:predicted transcriptional regulator